MTTPSSAELVRYWRTWVALCEREAQRHEAEAARWRGQKLDHARRELTKAETAGTLFEDVA